jgi:hypothetical protein
MEVSKEIKSKLISYLLSKGIERINSKSDIRDKIREFMSGDDRTLLLKIKEFSTLGFGIVEDRLVMLDDIDNPTVTILISEDAFIQVVRGKLTFREAFFYADCDVIGDDWLRDFVIFNSIFEQFRYVAQELEL